MKSSVAEVVIKGFSNYAARPSSRRRMQRLLAVLLIFMATFPGLHTRKPFSLKKQPCPCATVKPDDTEKWEKTHDRIVGGYDTRENKPWAARIWFNDFDFLCGGSLINKRYVLTAAHCICKPRQKLVCNKKNQPVYNIKTMYSVYLGVNQMKVNNDNLGLKGDRHYEYGVEWAQAYTPNKIYHDIGLLRLDRDAVIVKNVLQPICLPLKFDKSDVVPKSKFKAGKGLQVFTSGWGRLFSACVTDELGPVKGMKCKAPFFYRGNQISGCSRTRTPSAKDRDCIAFRRKNKKAYPKTPGDSVKIVIGNTTKMCHSIQSRNGWCKTESQGEPQDKVDDSQWGWCVYFAFYMRICICRRKVLSH